MKYGISKKLTLPFHEAVAKTVEALGSQGFGVLTEIDVKATLKKKIDVDFDNYTILGACNPKLAHQVLLAEKEIGLLLPCNVIVYEDDGEVYVSAMLPSAAMSMVDNPKVANIAQEVESKLRSVVASI